MLRWSVLRAFAFAALAALFAAGAVHLISLRMEHGDVFPPYSTLRADPLGAKVLYEAYSALPSVQIERNYRDIPHFHPAGEVTFLTIGISPRATWDPAELRDFSALLRSGSRGVFAFSVKGNAKEQPKLKSSAEEKHKEDDVRKGPSELKYERARAEAAEKEEEARQAKVDEERAAKKEASAQEKKDESTEVHEKSKIATLGEGAQIPFAKVAESWGAEIAYFPPHEYTNVTAEPSSTGGALAEGEPVSWHSPIYFAHLTPEWRVLYESHGKPVIIERSIGKGSLVFSGDSYFLSNEAMRKERRPSLLLWLIGASHVVFDETHLGVVQTDDITDLARRYRLQGCVLALLLAVVLFIWKSVVRFIPPYPHASHTGNAVMGRDSSEGLVSLLRRSIPRSEIFAKCLEEWRNSFGRDSTLASRMESALPLAMSKKPVDDYRSLASALQKTALPPKAVSVLSETPKPIQTL